MSYIETNNGKLYYKDIFNNEYLLDIFKILFKYQIFITLEKDNIKYENYINGLYSLYEYYDIKNYYLLYNIEKDCFILLNEYKEKILLKIEIITNNITKINTNNFIWIVLFNLQNNTKFYSIDLFNKNKNNIIKSKSLDYDNKNYIIIFNKYYELYKRHFYNFIFNQEDINNFNDYLFNYL